MYVTEKKQWVVFFIYYARITSQSKTALVYDKVSTDHRIASQNFILKEKLYTMKIQKKVMNLFDSCSDISIEIP